MQIVKMCIMFVKIAFPLINAVISLLRSLHEGSYGYPMINNLLQDFKFVQYPFSHF